MARQSTVYVCQQCGASYPQWLGRCPGCREWNTLVEEVIAVRTNRTSAPPAPLKKLSDVVKTQEERVSTGIAELDIVLGGGLVRGSVILVAGEPGVGKSTLVSQAAFGLCEASSVVYVSAEESPAQVALRMQRLGKVPEGLLITDEARVEQLVEMLSEGSFAIVDSIQTLRLEALESAQGSVAQVRECAARLHRFAKETDVTVILIGHVTKEGAIAGPRVLEHLVDVVLQFEGERSGCYRVLRSLKNRFGPTDEAALFEMGPTGLAPVLNPSEALLAERAAGSPGSAVVPVMEGSRCILAEIQALTAPSFLTNPRRVLTGVDYNRMTIVLAVMEKRLGMRLGAQDVFLNVAGGLRIEEPAADLAALLAVASSMRDTPLPEDLVAFGEVGLAGEVRSVAHPERRLKEAMRMGFRKAVVPSRLRLRNKEGIEIVRVSDVKEAVSASLPASQR